MGTSSSRPSLEEQSLQRAASPVVATELTAEVLAQHQKQEQEQDSDEVTHLREAPNHVLAPPPAPLGTDTLPHDLQEKESFQSWRSSPSPAAGSIVTSRVSRETAPRSSLGGSSLGTATPMSGGTNASWLDQRPSADTPLPPGAGGDGGGSVGGNGAAGSGSGYKGGFCLYSAATRVSHCWCWLGL